jgi:hypothetical protein
MKESSLIFSTSVDAMRSLEFISKITLTHRIYIQPETMSLLVDKPHLAGFSNAN